MYDTLHDAPGNSVSPDPRLNCDDNRDATEVLENVTHDVTSAVHNEDLDNLTTHVQCLNNQDGVRNDKDDEQTSNPDDFVMEMQNFRLYEGDLACCDLAN